MRNCNHDLWWKMPGRLLPWAAREWFLKIRKKIWCANDKTVIELGYRKISLFVGVLQINHLHQLSAWANNWPGGLGAPRYAPYRYVPRDKEWFLMFSIGYHRVSSVGIAFSVWSLVFRWLIIKSVYWHLIIWLAAWLSVDGLIAKYLDQNRTRFK